MNNNEYAASMSEMQGIIEGLNEQVVKTFAIAEELRAEIDALKIKVFIIHSAARFVVDADDEEGRKYHLAGLERALNLNQNECLAQVKHDTIMDAADSEADSIPEHDKYKAFAASILTQEKDT